MPEVRRKKAKRQASVGGEAMEHEPEEEVNPGMLLRDFIEEPVATARKAAKKRPNKVVKKKRPSANSSDEGETDLFSVGQSTCVGEANDAVASSTLIAAINAGPSKAVDARRSRHAEEAIPENEFHAGAAGDEITIEDLLAPMAESTGNSDVKKMLQGMSKKEAMPEPMSEVKQGREERQARYHASSNDIGKFIPQVQRMRKADQVTLGEEKDEKPNSTSALVGSFRASDDFEKELEAVTKAAGATEADMIDHKGLPMNSRIRDEAQTQQVARLKSLMLREQQANKRIKKIKSKTYHRIHRKAEHREREVLLGRLEVQNPELAKSLRQDYEKKHAERRLQRHGNARKKWAQTMNRFAKGDDGARKEIAKQAQDARDEQQALRRVIQGKDPDQSEDSEAMDLSDSDAEGDGLGKKGLAQRTVDKAKNLTLSELNELKKDGDLPTTGMFGLAFMRNAIKQKREGAKAAAQSVLHELEGLGARLDADSDIEDIADGKKKETTGKAASASEKRREFSAEELERAGKEVDLMFEQEDVTQAHGMSVSGPLSVRGVDAQRVPSAMKQSSTASSSTAPATSSQTTPADTSDSKLKQDTNPWLADDCEENPWTTDAVSPSAPSVPAADSKKAVKRGAAESAEPGGKKKRSKKAKHSPGNQPSDGEAEDSTAQVTSAAELLNVLDADAEAARQQRDLVRATFVEGTQAEDFDEEREDKLNEEEEKNKPSVLMGWGSWTGAGVKARPAPKPKASAKKAFQHSTPKPSHVQVYGGDAAVKAQAKYFVDKVPFPFKSPQQYDQEMRQPSGPEWNTLAGHLQRVKPKVFMKVGAVVAPLHYIKHLAPEHQENAIKTWGAGKQPKRLKARF